MTTDEVVITLTDADMREAIETALPQHIIDAIADLPLRYISQQHGEDHNEWRITFDARA